MPSRKCLTVIRFLLGFLLWPVILTLSLCLTTDAVLSHLGADPDGPALIMLGMMVMATGFVIPCLAVVFFGLPYVLVMLDQKQLGFRAVLIPTLLFSVVQPAIVYLSLCQMHPPHPLAEAIVAPQVPVVIMSGLLFYFVAVWKPAGKRS